MAEWATELERERFHNSMLFCALFALVDAIENNSGAEPSKSVYDRALDEAKDACCYYAASPGFLSTLTPEQRTEALKGFDGDDTLGDPASLKGEGE